MKYNKIFLQIDFTFVIVILQLCKQGVFMANALDFIIKISKIIFSNFSNGNISSQDVIEFRIEVEGREDYLISNGFDITEDYIRIVNNKRTLQYMLYFNDNNLYQYFESKGLNLRKPIIYNARRFNHCFSKNDYIIGLLNSGLHFGDNHIYYNFIRKYNNTYFRTTYM